MSILYFCLSGLDLLKPVRDTDKRGVHALLDVERQQQIISWVYANQLPARSPLSGGFRGSTWMGTPFSIDSFRWEYDLRGASEVDMVGKVKDRGDLGKAKIANDKGEQPSEGVDRRRHSAKKGISLPRDLTESSGGETPNVCLKTTDAFLKEYDRGHLAMGYTALVALCILGDDLSRVRRNDMLRFVQATQLLGQERKDMHGCCSASPIWGEADMRFLYCAAAVAYILADDGAFLDRDAAAAYIERCIGFDGGLGLTPNAESHGGAAYTGIAALVLMERLDAVFPKSSRRRRRLIRWCVDCQVGHGVGGGRGSGEGSGSGQNDGDGKSNGRIEGQLAMGPGGGSAHGCPNASKDRTGHVHELRNRRRRVLWQREVGLSGRKNKTADTCYSFWITATLSMLSGSENCVDLLDRAHVTAFTRRCQFSKGGFCKHEQNLRDKLPDILHSYYSVCGLSLLNAEDEDLEPLDARLGITQRTMERVQKARKRFREGNDVEKALKST